MKITFTVAALAIIGIAVSCGARAQQPAEDGRIAVYRQLLTRSQEEFASTAAQLQAAQIENAQLKAQIEKRKAEDNAPAEKKP